MNKMREKALLLLNALGVENAENDPLFLFIAQSVTEWILNEIHHSALPETLVAYAAQRVVGRYLQLLKNNGKLTDFDFDAAVKQITEGDTTIVYAIGEGSQTPEQRFDAMVGALCQEDKSQLYAHRRVAW